MNEESESGLVHEIGLGKGKGFSHQSPTSLAQCAIESFDVIGVGFGLILGELVGCDDFGVGFPDVGIAVSGFIGIGNGLPEFSTGSFAPSFAPTTDSRCHDLPGSAAQGEPDPTLVLASFDKTPEFIQLQHIAFSIHK